MKRQLNNVEKFRPRSLDRINQCRSLSKVVNARHQKLIFPKKMFYKLKLTLVILLQMNS